MRDTVASCSILVSCSSIFMVGYVSERDCFSSMRASHRTFILAFFAPFTTCASPRYAVRPPPNATDFETMLEEVSDAICTTFAPASWHCPLPASATDKISARAPRPTKNTEGYFMVIFEPWLPSIHSTSAFSSARARLVTRLYTLADQFWMVV